MKNSNNVRDSTKLHTSTRARQFGIPPAASPEPSMSAETPPMKKVRITAYDPPLHHQQAFHGPLRQEVEELTDDQKLFLDEVRKVGGYISEGRARHEAWLKTSTGYVSAFQAVVGEFTDALRREAVRRAQAGDKRMQKFLAGYRFNGNG